MPTVKQAIETPHGRGAKTEERFQRPEFDPLAPERMLTFARPGRHARAVMHYYSGTDDPFDVVTPCAECGKPLDDGNGAPDRHIAGFYPEQETVLAADAGIDFVVTGVGGGKTDVAAYKLVRWALENPRRASGAPTNWLVLGSDFKLVRKVQLEKILDQIRLINLPENELVSRVVGGNDPHIVLANGATILGMSGTDPDRMRGHEYDGFWQDEAELSAPDAFSIAINRMRSAECVRGIVTSTPNIAGWLWAVLNGEVDAWNDMRKAIPMRVHRWGSKKNKINKSEVLAAVAAAGEAIRPGMSKQELDGLFLGTKEAPGSGALDFGRAFVGRVRLESAADTKPAVLGVDLGMSQDFTVLTLLSQTGYVLAIDRFNASTPGSPRDRSAFYPFVEGKIIQLVQNWHIPLVKIDEAMHGASFAQQLKKQLTGIARVDGYRTDSHKRKAEAIEALGVALSRSAVRVPSSWASLDAEHVVQHVEQLRRELSELVATPIAGYRSFDHPPGGHDDMVVSLALAYQGIAAQRAAPSASIGNLRSPGPRRRF